MHELMQEHRVPAGNAPLTHEGLFDWLQRVTGRTDREAAGRLLGAANAPKEGDVTIGVAAVNEAQRMLARQLLAATTLRDVDAHPLFDDALGLLLQDSLDAAAHAATAAWTLEALKRFLLRESGAVIAPVARGLSSAVIGCVVKLLDDAELTAVSAKLFNVLPESRIGAPGHLGARLQPNSPTDDPEDIRWQVFCGWAYGTGDVLLGTNPVSSDPQSVATVEHALQDVIRTFGLEEALPHCVLAHIDVQAEVEARQPGSTALWFQSIAGSDAANRTFDLTVEKMLAHAATRTGRFGLYFETGQGADCTNGHAHGVDMVLHEARKFGFARALAQRVGAAQGAAGGAVAPWVIVNDVAGFIGPEVFRTREQLVRCCLEDLVMGKLHGLTMGLDVCATLHMDISLDDLDWCLDRLLPACPAYLMALPTKIDPMLGYLTTGFQDHVRLRARAGAAVNPPMQRFFATLGVMDDEGQPGPHFGDPLTVFSAYMRRKGDTRTDAELRAEGGRQLADVRARGVLVAEGCGATPDALAPELEREVRRIHDEAKLAFWAELPERLLDAVPSALRLETQSGSREEYILHPVTGEALSLRSRQVVEALRAVHASACDLQIVISDGLNALAIAEPGQLLPFLETLRDACAANGWHASVETLVIRAGRVRAGYRVGEALFGGRSGRSAIVHVIGERPGTGHRTYSVYVTVADGAAWAVPGRVDHDITRVISGVAHTALAPRAAAEQVARVLLALR